MKRIFLSVLSVALCSSFASSQTATVTGNAFLEGETDHGSVHVVFTRTAPTAWTDSVLTDALGSYSAVVEQGVYTIRWAKDGFLPITRSNLAVYADLTLPDTTLETSGLSGNISGVLTAGTYKVSGNLLVAPTDTLRIMPGVRLEFKAALRLTVQGRLEAVGTAADSIVFTAYDTAQRWDGIWFGGTASNGSHLSYALVEFSQAGGIRLENSSASLTHLWVRKNTMSHGLEGAYYGGAGIYVAAGAPTLDHLLITDNTSGSRGGGLYLATGTIQAVSNTVLERNAASDGGGGIYCRDGGLHLTNAMLSQNTGGAGPGINFSGARQDLILSNVLLRDHNGGGGTLWLEYPNNPVDVRLTNVTLVGEKSGHGIYVAGSYRSLSIHNSILANNRQTGLAFVYGSTPADVRTSCFYGNLNGNIWNGPTFLTTNITVNAKGDSCDAWSNITLPPMFADSANADYRLTLASPCINAGATDSLMLPADLDGNSRPVGWAPDMGAYEAQSVLALSPGILDFGSTRIGHEKDSVFTLTNAGEEPVTVTSITAGSGVFSARTDSLSIPAMGSAADTLRFTPAAPGDTSGYVVIVSNDPASPDTIAVTGFGASSTMTISRREVDFGTVRVGHSVDSLITITNTGNTVLVIDSIVSDNPSVTITRSSLTLAIGASATDTLRFSPALGDSILAHIVVASNAFSSPDTVTARGFGATYGFSLSARSVDLGTVRVGNSRDTVISVTNMGNTVLVIDSIISDSPWITCSPSSMTIPVGASATDTLHFSPAAGDSVVAHIVFAGGGSPDTVGVRGFGATYGFSLSARSLDMGTVRVGLTRDTVITITNTGNQPIQITGVSSSSPQVVALPTNVALPIGGEAQDTLRLTPTAEGEFTAHVVFTSDSAWSDTITVVANGTLTDVLAVAEIPKEYSLSQNYPNPFNPSTTIRYGLPRKSVVVLAVYNAIGQRVATLVDEEQEAAFHEVRFNAGRLASGVYFYRIHARQADGGQGNDFVQVRRLILMK